MEIKNTNKNDPATTELEVVFVNVKGEEIRCIRSTCKLIRDTYIPLITFTHDKFLEDIFGSKSLYFYNTETQRFNFYCTDIISLSGSNYKVPNKIIVEVLEFDGKNLILSPGFWARSLDGKLERRRVCDAWDIYQILTDMDADECTDATKFHHAFFYNVENRNASNSTEVHDETTNTKIDEDVTTDSKNTKDSIHTINRKVLNIRTEGNSDDFIVKFGDDVLYNSKDKNDDKNEDLDLDVKSLYPPYFIFKDNIDLTGTLGSIHVPESLVNTYKNSPNWGKYADRFIPMPDFNDFKSKYRNRVKRIRKKKVRTHRIHK